MDLQKLTDLVSQTNDMINNLKDIEKTYLDKIDGYLSELNAIKDKSANHSKEYVDRKNKEFTDKIQGVVDNANKTIKKKISDITDWFNGQQTTIKTNIAKSLLAKIGVPANTSSVETMVKTIPDVPMPEIKIPELKVSDLLNL